MRTRIACLSLAFALGAGVAPAQQSSAPTYSQVHCSGMFSTEAVPYDTYLVSGEQSRTQTTFHPGDYVFINKGSSAGVKVGDEFWVIRKAKDSPPSWFRNLYRVKQAMGTYWKDVARLRVAITQADTSTAQIVFSCDYVQRGDYVLPYAQRPAPAFKKGKFDRWAAPSGRETALVVAGQDWAVQTGTGHIVYVDLGGTQGVNVGDYFRFFRYQGTRNDFAYQEWRYATRQFSFGKTPVPYRWDQLPREVVGEGVVVRASERSSTVLVTYALREIYAGDYAELEPPEPVEAAPPPAPAPAPAANRSPSMSCAADRSPVTAGERVRITARASDPDGDALTYAWRTNGGQLSGSGSAVALDTTGLRPGRYLVTGQVSDGRTAAADCTAEVVVQPAEAPAQASKLNECIFRLSSAGVDNVCKRILDDVALRLKNDPRSQLVIVGFADPGETGAARLATQRAENARQYLLSGGIATARVDVRSASGQAGAGRQNRRVDLIWVPAGSTY